MTAQELFDAIENKGADPGLPVRIDGITSTLDIAGVDVRTDPEGQQYIALQTAPRTTRKPVHESDRPLA